jgi:hypothetical protein
LAMADSKIQGWRRRSERSLPGRSLKVFMRRIVAAPGQATSRGRPAPCLIEPISWTGAKALSRWRFQHLSPVANATKSAAAEDASTPPCLTKMIIQRKIVQNIIFIKTDGPEPCLRRHRGTSH